VRKAIPGVNGIAVVDRVSDKSPASYGFDFVESAADDISWARGRVNRAVANGTSSAWIHINVPAEAQFRLTERDRVEGFYFFEDISRVTNQQTGEVIAEASWYRFRGGIAEQIFMAFTDAGRSTVASCGDYSKRRSQTLVMLRAAFPKN